MTKTGAMLALILVFLLTACNGEGAAPDATVVAPSPDTELATIAPTATETPPTATIEPPAQPPQPTTPPLPPSPVPPTTTSAPPAAVPDGDGTVAFPPIAEVPSDLPAYDRDAWRHWTDADGDCQNARHEVLIAESLTPVTFKSERQCQVAAGQWWGAFTDTTVTNPGDLDIDHLVPLKNAHESGGWAWDAARKRQYANALDDADHLIAVTAGANRSKGAKGPDQWKPPNTAYWCEYATDWARVKITWGLTVTAAEATALQEMVATCDGTALQPTPTVAPAPAVPTPVMMATTDSFNPQDYIGQGNKFNCGDFKSQAQAQAVLRADPTDPNRLDGTDQDGLACESRPAPRDLTPVAR